MIKYAPTELVLNDEQKVYHLGLSSDMIAEKIILVGDQDRVNLIAEQFDEVECSHQHREFNTITGKYKGKRITALSTGIGTDNIDIVVNELDALANIDATNRQNKPSTKTLELVRIGTCGILNPKIPVNSYLISDYACGLDNVAHFYDIKFSQTENKLLEEINSQVNFPQYVNPYLVSSSNELSNRFKTDITFSGITITSSGFYGPQGRQLRLKTHTTKLNDQLTHFENDSVSIINFEMESSALFALGKALGHKCSTICLGIANRPNMEFSSGYKEHMKKLITHVLDKI